MIERGADSAIQCIPTGIIVPHANDNLESAYIMESIPMQRSSANNMPRKSPSPRSPSDVHRSSSIISESSSRILRNTGEWRLRRSPLPSRENSGEISGESSNVPTNIAPSRRIHRSSSSRENSGEIREISGESNITTNLSSRRLQRSSSSSRENPGEINNEGGDNAPATTLPSSNGHLHLKNYQPHQNLSSISSSTNITSSSSSPSSFFVMITGHIESAQSDDIQPNDSLYCRYSFSYGPDWNIVHGVSVGLSQISRRGVLGSIGSNNEGGNSSIVWNFPIEISFQSTNPHGWPRLALSVYGFDFLGRDVLRGYASLLLPVCPGRHTKYMKTYRPVSGSKFVQFVNWLMGTNPEYYDSKMSTRGEGRSVTRVTGGNRRVKVNLMVTVKDFPAFGYVSPPSSKNC